MPSQAETIQALRNANLLVDPTYSPNNPADPHRAAMMFGSALGIPDAIRALKGEMTDDEQQKFAVTAAMGLGMGFAPFGKLIEGAAPAIEEAAGPAIKSMGELLPDAFKNSPGLAKMTPKEYLKSFSDMGMSPPPKVMQALQMPPKTGVGVPRPLPVSGMGVESNPAFGAALKGYMSTPSKTPVTTELSDEEIEKALAKNPGASIYDLAGVNEPNSPAAAGGLKLMPSSEPGDYFIHDPSGKQIGEVTSYGPKGGYHLAMTGTPFATLVNSPDEALGQAQKYLTKSAAPPPAPVQTDYSKHIQPLDWQNFMAASAAAKKVGGLQPPAFPNPETQARAASLGFNTNLPLFKGGYRSDYPEETFDPATKKSFERGNFLTDAQSVAKTYAKTGSGGGVLPYVARAKNPGVIDWQNAVGDPDYNETDMHDIVEAARGKGHDLLVVKGVHDLGGGGMPQNQYVALDPSILRAPTAKFDPAKVAQPWPLAGITGGAIGAGSVSPQIDEYIKALQGQPNQQ
jgi:hypothetical protein